MRVFQYNTVLVAVILIGLMAALVVDLQRHHVEKQNMQVDLVVDYENLARLAESEGVMPEEVFRQAKEAGITSLAVYETSFQKFNANGKATATPGSAILQNYRSGALADPAWRALVENGRIQGAEVYVTGQDDLVFQEVKEDLRQRLGSHRVESLDVGGREVLAVKANYDMLLKMSLGMPTDEMRAVNDAGFYVLPRPGNYENASAEDVRAVFRRLDGFRISEIVFAGNQMLGSPKALQATVDELKERNIVLGLIEATNQLKFYEQDGLEEVSRRLGYDRIARLYVIPKDEQPKLKADVAVERWANTDMERNIRIDLLRTYDKPAPNQSLLETNMAYFRAVHDLLEEKGFSFGPASTFEAFYPSKFLRALMMLGIVAAGILYLSLVCPQIKPRKQYLMLVVFGLLAAVPVLMGNGAKIRVLAAFASANLFPALAVIWQLDRIRAVAADRQAPIVKIVVTAALALFVTSALSYVGAAYLSGSLADVEYLLEFNIFRGIKLTFILPIVLVAIAFLQRYDVFGGADDTEGAWGQIKKILDMPIKLKTLLILVFIAAAGVVFIARSGHTSGMPVSGLEIRFRTFLEKAFYARPRSKEILIGHPAFMLAAMAWYRKWPTMVFFALVLAATIGQGSMVETFAHMRTPVYMSFMRGIGGVMLGAGLGAVLMVLVQLWQTVVSAAKGRRAEA